MFVSVAARRRGLGASMLAELERDGARGRVASDRCSTPESSAARGDRDVRDEPDTGDRRRLRALRRNVDGAMFYGKELR